VFIFLDESKGFNKEDKKIVFWWLITNLTPSSIDKLYYSFLDEKWLTEKNWEIKSFDHRYEKHIFDFHNFLKKQREFEDIEFIWAFCKWYKESWENYYKILVELVKYAINKNKFNHSKIRDIKILADHVKLSYTDKDIKIKINNDPSLNKDRKKFNIQKIHFDFENSKSYWWIKFSDFIAWILRKKYILREEEDLPCWFEECFVWNDIIIVKLK